MEHNAVLQGFLEPSIMFFSCIRKVLQIDQILIVDVGGRHHFQHRQKVVLVDKACGAH